MGTVVTVRTHPRTSDPPKAPGRKPGSSARSVAFAAGSVELQRPRPGGRATRVVSAVLQATIEELGRLGYEALRVEDVAARASVNKTTVYRRWPTKTDLVVAALRETSHGLDFIPDTGSVRGDMLALLERAATRKDASTVRAFISLLLAASVAPEITRLVTLLRLEYRERWTGIVRRGIARGELPSSTSAHLLAELAASVPTMRKLRNDEPLDGATCEAIVDLLLAGARSVRSDAPSRADSTPKERASTGRSAERRAPRTRADQGPRAREPRRRAM